MKKLSTTFGLLALMLIVTSFTTPSQIGGGRQAGEGSKGTGTSTGGELFLTRSQVGGGKQTGEGSKGTGTSTGGEYSEIGGRSTSGTRGTGTSSGGE